MTADPHEPVPRLVDLGLRVVGEARRSLFDAVKPSLVQAAGSRIRGPGGVALAALQQEAVTGGRHSAADSVVIGGRAFGAPRQGWVQTDEAGALGVAYGLAAARLHRTAAGRTWCLMRMQTLAHGRTLETAATLHHLRPASLIPVIVGPAGESDRITGLLDALGIDVHAADNSDAWSVMSAFDHAARVSDQVHVAVVAGRP